MSRAELKERAKSQLGRNIFGNQWLLALAACLIVSAVLSVGSATGIVTILLVGAGGYALALIFLKQARTGAPIDMADLLCGFTDDFGQVLLLGLLQNLFIFLWSLLFVIPGIVKTYAYSMAYYIKVDHPDYDWRRCLDESQQMMKGHKGDLFVLDLSFIGWYFIGALCLGIGTLWVVPYHNATRAQFYLSLQGAQQQPGIQF